MAAPIDNQAAFHRLIGRALYDTDFRKRLMDPERRTAALSEVEFSPTAEQREQFNKALQAVDELAAALGVPRIAM